MHRRYDAANIPIELLRTLVTIAEVGTLTRAADLHRLTQPAISAQIKRLQQIVGAEVLRKWGAGVRPTEQGETVVRYARRILALNDQILLQTRTRTDLQVTRIGLCELLAPATLPRLLAALREARGAGVTQIECAPSGNIAHRFASGYLDIAVMPVAQQPAASPLAAWNERLAWLCARDFLLSPGKPIPLIAYPGSVAHQVALDALERAGQLYTVALSAADWTTRLAALGAGLGYIVASERLCAPSLKTAREYYLPRLPDVALGIFADPNAAAARIEPVAAALTGVFITPHARAPSTGRAPPDKSRPRPRARPPAAALPYQPC